MSFGGNGCHISKPIKREKLYDIIDKYLNRYIERDTDRDIDTGKDTNKNINIIEGKEIRSDTDNKPADIPKLLDNLSGKKEILKELLTYAIQFFPVSCKKLETLIVKKEYDKVRSLAHSIFAV